MSGNFSLVECVHGGKTASAFQVSPIFSIFQVSKTLPFGEAVGFCVSVLGQHSQKSRGLCSCLHQTKCFSPEPWSQPWSTSCYFLPPLYRSWIGWNLWILSWWCWSVGECEYYLAMFYLSQTAVEVQLNLETHKKWLQAFPYAFFNCFSLNLLRGSILADVLTICNCPGN